MSRDFMRNTPIFRTILLTVTVAVVMLMSTAARALDAAHQAIARETVAKGLAYLATTQEPDGSWSPKPGPAVTAMVMSVMLDQPDIGPEHPAVAKALRYILDRVQPDGSIRDGAEGILANYNTAICLSALARVHNDPEVAAAIKGAQTYLKDLQWSVGDVTPDGETITADHPFNGGTGYGNSGRPDNSNLQMMLQGLYDSGVDCNDPAFQNALLFIQRTQGIAENDYYPQGTIVQDGGVIYSNSVDGKNNKIPVSYANPDMVDEGKAGRPVSGLRGYGSMTYAAFKSYLYANLQRDDPRVLGALKWIQNNYTLDQNPGMPEALKLQGLYYYYMTHARALSAYGSTFLDLPYGSQVDWANNLIDKLAGLQSSEGSFVNEADRWMEGDPLLVTAYALIALQAASQ